MNKTKYIFITVGILILIFLFMNFGLDKTAGHLAEMGLLRFGLIVSIFFFSNIALTWGWRVLIAKNITAAMFFQMVLARTAGDATSSLNAAGAIAGEPLKAMFIKSFIPFKTGLASVVLDRTAHIVANTFMMLTGLIVSLFVLKIPITATIAALMMITGLFVFLLFLIRKQKSGLISYIISLLPGFLSEKIFKDDRADKISALDNEIKHIFSSPKTRKRFYLSVIIHYFAVIISCTFEIYLILTFINPGSGFTLIHGLFVYIFGFILTSALFFMPANIGTSEGSYALALKFLGYDPALGLSVGIIRRFRTFVWAGLGMLILIIAGFTKKQKNILTDSSK